jgi:two-component system chemotaxis response regulator CheY
MAKTVLVVDDSHTVVQQMSAFLDESGDFKVVGRASSADDALRQYALLKPDVVTMDIVMPGGDAIEAIRQIIASDAKARIVVVSSLGGVKEKVVEALSAGAKNVIVKPLEKERVVQVLRSLR